MYETMTIEQLQNEQTTLYERIKMCTFEQRAINTELDRRAAIAEAERTLAHLSPGAKAHLAQQIGAASIAPQAAVGTPGATK